MNANKYRNPQSFFPISFHSRNSLTLLLMLTLIGCSSAPKNPGDVYDLRRRGETQLDQGNRQADRGGLEGAMVLLDEALRIAVIADDSGLRIRAGLSRGNVLFSLGRRDEAAESWNSALAEALRTGSQELAAVCRIHISRGRLLSSPDAAAAQAILDELNRDLALIKSDRMYTAFAWTVSALAEKELGRFAQAESALRRSLEIHEKDRNFELAAYNWFLAASFRSLSGDYPGALKALDSAIAYDRRIENSWGLANDWRAVGDVRKKSGDREAARAAYTRAAEIFRALDHESAADEALARADGI